MKTKILVVVFFIIFQMVNRANGQHYVTKWTQKTDKKIRVVEVVKCTDGAIYCQTFWGRHRYKQVFKFSKVLWDGRVLYSKKLKIKIPSGKKLPVIDYFAYNNKLLAFTRRTETVNKERRQIVYGAIFNLNGIQVGSAIILDTLTLENKYIMPCPVMINQSPDKSKLLLVNWSTQSVYNDIEMKNYIKDGQPISSLRVSLFDSAFNHLASYYKKFKGFSKENIYFEPIAIPGRISEYIKNADWYEDYRKNFVVTNNGDIYFTAFTQDSVNCVSEYKYKNNNLVASNTYKYKFGSFNVISHQGLTINNSNNILLFSEHRKIDSRGLSYAFYRNKRDSISYTFINRKNDKCITRFIPGDVFSSLYYIGEDKKTILNNKNLHEGVTYTQTGALGKNDGGFYLAINQNITDTMIDMDIQRKNYILISITFQGEIDWINSFSFPVNHEFYPFIVNNNPVFLGIINGSEHMDKPGTSNYNENLVKNNLYVVSFSKNGQKTESYYYIGEQAYFCDGFQMQSIDNNLFMNSMLNIYNKGYIGIMEIK